jgi:DeoR/GlpR family transcriptional regulator of sugar metabolism
LFEIPYRDVSERTARRDLAKLRKEGYILKEAKGEYIFNFKLLG